MYRVAYDTTKVNKKRWILEGDEYGVKEGNIIVLAMMIKPNYPPVKYFEKRFTEWNPLLDIHPEDLEKVHPPIMANANCKNWPKWSDYDWTQKVALRRQAAINRTSDFEVGFEPLKALQPTPRTWAPVQSFIPPHLALMITIEQGFIARIVNSMDTTMR